MPSLRRHEGYVLIENPNNAPTLPGAPGYGVRGKFEAGIITCAHCQAGVLVNPMRTRDRGYCRKCDHYVCDAPACNAGCLPMRQVLQVAHDAANRGRDVEADVRRLRATILGEVSF